MTFLSSYIRSRLTSRQVKHSMVSDIAAALDIRSRVHVWTGSYTIEGSDDLEI